MSKKIFSIYPRTKDAQVMGLKTEKGRLDFGGKTVINTSNASLAREIEDKYGAKVGGSAMVVHDEQLSNAKDSGSWDIVKTARGDAVKNLHNYTFGAESGTYAENYERIFRSKPTKIDEAQKVIAKNHLSHFVWVWNTHDDHGEWEFGFRLFGFEFKHKYHGKTLVDMMGLKEQ